MGKIKELLIILLALKKLFVKNMEKGFSLNFGNTFFSWKNGFLPESYIIYDFEKNSSINYLSDFDRTVKIPKINGINSLIIDSKLLFAKSFKKDIIISPLYFINNHKIIRFSDGKIIDYSNFLSLMKDNNEFVFKPDGGGGGFGVKFIKYKNSKWFVNGKEKELNYITNLLKKLDKTLVYYRIIQTGFASEVFENSLNTIRILTMIDPVSKIPFIASAVFRCGTSKTYGVDNWSNGGLSAYINLNSGVLSKAVSYPHNGELKWLEKHPDTGFVINKFRIPDWDNIKNEIINLSQEYFFIPYIGWDIIPMEKGFKILEANSNSDVNLLQVHDPLLKKDKVKAFFKYYNVI